jgi:glycosyltransferase involved in cell wall biosynthesis
VHVVPLRIGAGSRLKILEALALGRAVVSTRVGAEGLDLTDSEHLVLADEPRAFAAATVALLRDRDRRRALGAAGRRRVEEEYDWKSITAPLLPLYEQLVAASARKG